MQLNKMSLIRKLVIVTISCLVMIITLLLFPLNSFAQEEKLTETDFYQLSEKTSIVAIDNENTKVTMVDDYADSRIVYGDKNKNYLVDLTSFTLKITPEEIENNGRFTVTFTNERNTQPLVGEAEGISFVFRLKNGSHVEIAILDAKNGELIDEMKGVQWAYLGSEETNWDNGIIGQLSGKYGIVKNSELILKFISDTASSGGTTFRPAMGNSSLGVAIPISVFTARDLDIKNLVLMISSGEGNQNYNFADGSQSHTENGNDIVLKLSKVEEPNTRKYQNNNTRIDLINEITEYVQNVDKLLNAELEVDLYNDLVNKVFDLSVLRNRDQYQQSSRIILALEKIQTVKENLNNIKTLAINYQEKNELLSDLGSLTEANINDAKQARDEFQAAYKYFKYLSLNLQNEVNAIIESINNTYILRAELDQNLKEFENAVSLFKDDINKANPLDILVAIEKRDLIDIDKFMQLDENDKTNFDNRFNQANTILQEALAENLFNVEKERVNIYYQAVIQLTNESTQSEYLDAFMLRPEINTSPFTEEEKDEILGLLENTDNLFNTAIINITNEFLTTYQAAVSPLLNRENINETSIQTAIDSKYDQDFVDTLVFIANSLSLDLSTTVSKLQENDRLVMVAQKFFDAKIYRDKINSIEQEHQLQDAYNLRQNALEHLNAEVFTETEKDEYETFFNNADNLMNDKAKSYIKPRIEALEKAVDQDLKLTIRMNQAKNALAAVPNLQFLTNEEDYNDYVNRYNTAYQKMKAEDLYYFTADEASSWSAQVTDKGVLLTGKNDEGTMNIHEPLNIDGLDIVFEYTKIGRIWQGEVDGKYPQNILVLNFMREYGKIKDQSQGFSIYLNPNILGELEVNIYGADRDGANILLAQGKISNLDFEDPNNPYEIRIRINKISSPLNCYQIWINSLKLNVYYRDFINFEVDSPLHISEFNEGSEIGEHIFIDDKAYLTFVLFGQELTDEERISQVTVKMLNEKTFAGYVPPLLPIEMVIESEPNKLTYKKGESLDLTGLVVKIKMSDGSWKTIDNNDLIIDGFSTNSKGTKVVSLTYTEEGISLTKVIRVTVEDDEVTDQGDESNKLGLIIGLSVGGAVLVGLGVCGFIFIRKKKVRKV